MFTEVQSPALGTSQDHPFPPWLREIFACALASSRLSNTRSCSAKCVHNPGEFFFFQLTFHEMWSPSPPSSPLDQLCSLPSGLNPHQNTSQKLQRKGKNTLSPLEQQHSREAAAPCAAGTCWAPNCTHTCPLIHPLIRSTCGAGPAQALKQSRCAPASGSYQLHEASRQPGDTVAFG